MGLFFNLKPSVLTRPVLEINLNALLDNYRLLSNMAGQATAAAVVKDDAYGLQADIVAKTLYEKGGCRHFFVAHAFEAEKIVSFVPQATIYVLQGIGADSLPLYKKYPFVPVISTPEMLAYFKKTGLKVRPAIQVETGLNRLGFRLDDLQKLSKKDLKLFCLVLSHLACADEQAHFMNAKQLINFCAIKNKYFKDLPASLSASDGLFLGKEYHFDMLRLGAAIYGINTAPYRENQMKNEITLKAPVLQVCSVKKGEFIGYSATYRAETDKKIAVVSVGYGDGIPRTLSNVGKVFFKSQNKRFCAPMLGRVSMDNIVCDVTNIKNVKVGDFAYLIDDDYTLDDMAHAAQTIAYELLSNIAKSGRYIKKYILQK